MNTNDKLRFGGRCQKHPLNILPCEKCAKGLPADCSPGVFTITDGKISKQAVEALAASKPEPSTDIHSCHPNCYRPECVAERDASKPEPQAQEGEPEVVSMADFLTVAQGAADSERRSLEVIARMQCETAEMRQAIAKKDAALKACVEALNVVDANNESYVGERTVASAITQAQEARK